MKGYLLLVNSAWALHNNNQVDSSKFDFFNLADIGSKLAFMSLHKHDNANLKSPSDSMLVQTYGLPELSKDEMDDAMVDAFGGRDKVEE